VRPALRLAWFRFRATFSRRWGGLLAIVLLIGLVGGLAMGAIAGARRTQSSFPAYLRETNQPNLGLSTAIVAAGVDNTPYDASVVRTITRLPHVKHVANFTIVNPEFTPLAPIHGHTVPGEAPPTIGGSLDGAYSTTGRVTVTSGRLANPDRVDEMFMSAGAARQAGMHIGSVLPVGFFTNAQLQLPQCCSANGKGKYAPHLKVNLKLVGIGVIHPEELVEDDVEALADDVVLLTPALMRELVPCCAFVTQTGIVVAGGNRYATTVANEIATAIPKLKGLGSSGHPVFLSVEEAKAERAIEPESIALAGFGVLAALAVLVIASQLIGRQLRLDTDERAVLRALGAGPRATTGDGLVGILGAVVLGGLLADAVAIACSPLGLLGPVRRVEHRSVSLDWTVLGLGLVALTVGLSIVAIAIAARQAPHRIAYRPRARARGSRAGRAAANAGLSTPATTGIRFALGSGRGANAVPVRSAIAGAVLALVVVTSTVTFGASLHTLVSRPALYGWNWNYELLSGFSGQEDLPQKQVTSLVDHDRYVSASTGIYFGAAQIDGVSVPIEGATPNAAVAPPVLSGHGLEAADQIVLGASTLAALHKHLGDTVTVNAGAKTSTTLRVVGTATMPSIGTSQNHTTMGTGAWLSYQLIPPQIRNLQGNSIPGPQAVLVRIRTGTNPTAARRSLQQISNTINRSPESPAGGVTGVLRPAEIVNYRAMGSTPALLATTLAFGATAALALTLVASVRRRRRDLALLKTLGFTRRQLAAVIAWQSTIAAGIGVVIGVPAGIILGRAFWNLFAHAIHAVPEPTVPAITILLLALGALVLANLVAAIPGIQAARTRTALLLQAE
jgi:hypothetical protein